MFGKERMQSPAMSSAAPVSKIETVLGPNAHFIGEIQSDGGVRIEGIFEGTVDITGNLVVSESAKVLATIKANNVSVSGAVKGSVQANRVEILETGRIWGDLTVNSLLLNEGAYLRGQTFMHGDIEFPMIEAPKSTSLAKPANAEIVDVAPKIRRESESE